MSSGNEEALFAGIMIFVAIGALLVFLAIQAFICFLVAKLFSAIPPEHRKQEPGMVWLLMIPCFSLVWNFFVFPKLAESFQSAFAAKGRTDLGDCGAQISLFYCIAAACSIIPFLNYAAGPVALVLLIIVLVKGFELKKQL